MGISVCIVKIDWCGKKNVRKRTVLSSIIYDQRLGHFEKKNTQGTPTPCYVYINAGAK